MRVICTAEDCIWNWRGECDCDEITISDKELRADGFYPRCKDYQEKSQFEEE